MTSPVTFPLTRPLTFSLTASLGSEPGQGALLEGIPQSFYAAPPASSFGSGGLYECIIDAANTRIFRLDLTDNAILEFNIADPTNETLQGSFQSKYHCASPYALDVNPTFTRLYVCVFGNFAVTVNSSTDTITLNGHGLIEGKPIVFNGTTAPSPLVFGTIYFAKNVTTNTFQVAATSGGAAIDLTTTGSSVKLGARGMCTYDISVPGTISLVGQLDNVNLSDTRAVSYISSTRLAIVDGTSGMGTINNGTEATPHMQVGAGLFSGAIGMCRDCRYFPGSKLLAVSSRNPTAEVLFDFSSVDAPTVKGSVSDATGLKLLSQGVWNAAGTKIITVGTGTRNTPASGGDTIGVIDVSTPTAPVLLGYLQDQVHLSGSRRVALSPSERYAYVANNSRDSLAIVDLIDPTKPKVVAEAIGSPHVGEASAPTGSQYGANHGLAVYQSGGKVYALCSGDFPTWGWRATFDVSRWP